MKLLIVDDEDIIREGIVEKIAWKENGFTLTTPGKNGLDAKEIIERENDELFQSLNEKYLKAIEKITNDEINYFLEDYILPKSLENLVQLDLSKNDNRFYFIQIPDMTPSTGGYFIEDFVYNVDEYNDDELFVNNDEF